jgi:hypothetical protein
MVISFNNSPTLTTRQLQTDITAESDDVILLGGLRTNSVSDSDSGFSFLPKWLWSKTGDSSGSEILLVLSVKRI